MIGCWSWVGEARGQAAGPAASREDGPDSAKPAGSDPGRQPELERIEKELKDLGQAQGQAQGGPGSEVDRLKAQVDLQQKQIDVLLRMTRLLADQVKKEPATAADLEKLQEQVATQDARIEQGARRAQELARARDDILERFRRLDTRPAVTGDPPGALHADSQ